MQYIKNEEPTNESFKRVIWYAAIGLQKVDSLIVSNYLRTLAEKNITNQISITEVGRLLDYYYHAKEMTRTKEADLVSYRLVKLLYFPSSPKGIRSLIGIHNELFDGLDPNSDKFRLCNITKAESILNGESVMYTDYRDIEETLKYDLREEEKYVYDYTNMEECVSHISRFIAGLWQIHPFMEGNTRTIALFLIRYLQSKHLNVYYEVFKNNSKYFRNSLVRANYHNSQTDVCEDISYLELFMRNLMLGEENTLNNNDLNIGV